MSETHVISLDDLHRDGVAVEARLIERVDVTFAKHADDAWQPFIAMAKAEAAAGRLPPIQVEHSHWLWREKVEASAHLLSYPTLGIECEGEVQGLMIVLTDGAFSRIAGKEALPLVYVYYLSTAPWNFPAFTLRPRFGGVGTVLLQAAVQISMDLGFKGRIGLHSLPQSERFYEQCGMISLGIDRDKQHMKYYEMTEDRAQTFFR